MPLSERLTHGTIYTSESTQFFLSANLYRMKETTQAYHIYIYTYIYTSLTLIMSTIPTFIHGQDRSPHHSTAIEYEALKQQHNVEMRHLNSAYADEKFRFWTRIQAMTQQNMILGQELLAGKISQEETNRYARRIKAQHDQFCKEKAIWVEDQQKNLETFLRTRQHANGLAEDLAASRAENERLKQQLEEKEQQSIVSREVLAEKDKKIAVLEAGAEKKIQQIHSLKRNVENHKGYEDNIIAGNHQTMTHMTRKQLDLEASLKRAKSKIVGLKAQVHNLRRLRWRQDPQSSSLVETQWTDEISSWTPRNSKAMPPPKEKLAKSNTQKLPTEESVFRHRYTLLQPRFIQLKARFYKLQLELDTLRDEAVPQIKDLKFLIIQLFDRIIRLSLHLKLRCLEPFNKDHQELCDLVARHTTIEEKDLLRHYAAHDTRNEFKLNKSRRYLAQSGLPSDQAFIEISRIGYCAISKKDRSVDEIVRRRSAQGEDVEDQAPMDFNLFSEEHFSEIEMIFDDDSGHDDGEKSADNNKEETSESDNYGHYPSDVDSSSTWECIRTALPSQFVPGRQGLMPLRSGRGGRRGYIRWIRGGTLR